MTDINKYISNKLQRSPDGVWEPAERVGFAYSDGRIAEDYLGRVFARASDLSSSSVELEKYIKDWPSEYHLTRKRANILRGMDFGDIETVIEVGSGCGAITRYLGEQFKHVIGIEGSRVRAHLAKLRTRDLDNVEIVCSPFQDVVVKQKVDILFCIGVFEYASAFVDSDTPYEDIIDYFSQSVSDNGMLVLAIENQYGLKYFSGCSEDHTGLLFDGVESYPHYGGKARTFGLPDLMEKIGARFKEMKVFFPYPDYKVPECVVADSFVGHSSVYSMISGYESRDYVRKRRNIFSERLALYDIHKNGLIPIFANSFLVIAAKKVGGLRKLSAPELLRYNFDRGQEYQTKSTVYLRDGEYRIKKERMYPELPEENSRLRIRMMDERLVEGENLGDRILRKARAKGLSIEDVFGEEMQAWYVEIEKRSYVKGGKRFLKGEWFDAIWDNVILTGDGCVFIDNEWDLDEDIRIEVLVVRACFKFLEKACGEKYLNRIIRYTPTGKLIKKMASCVRINITDRDIEEFVKFEAGIQRDVAKVNQSRAKYWYGFVIVSNIAVIAKVKGVAYEMRRARSILARRVSGLLEYRVRGS